MLFLIICFLFINLCVIPCWRRWNLTTTKNFLKKKIITKIFLIVITSYTYALTNVWYMRIAYKEHIQVLRRLPELEVEKYFRFLWKIVWNITLWILLCHHLYLVVSIIITNISHFIRGFVFMCRLNQIANLLKKF